MTSLFSLAVFKIFYLPLSYNSLIISIFMCISLLIHPLGVHRTWVFIKFGKFSAIISSNILCTPFSLSSSSGTPTVHMMICSVVSLRFFHPSLFLQIIMFFPYGFIFVFSFMFLNILNPYLAVFFNFTVISSS